MRSVRQSVTSRNCSMPNPLPCSVDHPVNEAVHNLWAASGTRRGKVSDNYPYAPWTIRQLSLPSPAYNAYSVGKTGRKASRNQSFSHMLYPAVSRVITEACGRLYTLSTGPITTTTKYINIYSNTPARYSFGAWLHSALTVIHYVSFAVLVRHPKLHLGRNIT